MTADLPDLSALVEPFDVLDMVRAAGVLPEAMTERLVSAELLPITGASPQLIVEVGDPDRAVLALPHVTKGGLQAWRFEFAGITFRPSKVRIDWPDEPHRIVFRDATEEPA